MNMKIYKMWKLESDVIILRILEAKQSKSTRNCNFEIYLKLSKEMLISKANQIK